MSDSDRALIEAVAGLWAIQWPGPDNLFEHPAFCHLDQVCRTLFPSGYQGGFHQFALMNGLRSLGMPCVAPQGIPVTMTPDQATGRLLGAFQQTTILRTHFCPLDCADELPSLMFGSAMVRSFTERELHNAMDADRLLRFHPNRPLEAARLVEFQWLIIREQIDLPSISGVREFPGWSFDPNEDFAAIDPHQRRFPQIVEDALFFLLLAPWEEWTEMRGFQWRGFHVPWIYTIDNDIFDRPAPPPAADTLSWEPGFHIDGEGREIEFERPSRYPFSVTMTTDLPLWNQSFWERVQKARATTVFETPTAHFFVRAFLDTGIDEFLNHITTLEAAIGLGSDFSRRGATRRMARRIAKLLSDPSAEQMFVDLYDRRSQFLHGRIMNQISGESRNRARTLARRVAAALIPAALQLQSSTSRETYLQSLA